MLAATPERASCAIRIPHRTPRVLAVCADYADRDGGDIFGTNSAPGVRRGRYWDDRLQCWTDKPSPAIQRLMYSEATMPGDVADLDSVGMAEGESIWNRMAAIIRARSLDVRILMDAHDRRNYGFVDIPTFRRSLCYAFGNQWIDLAMTSAELKEICAPYLTRKPNAKGEPEAFVLWQKFTTDLQALADKKRPTTTSWHGLPRWRRARRRQRRWWPNMALPSSS